MTHGLAVICFNVNPGLIKYAYSSRGDSDSRCICGSDVKTGLIIHIHAQSCMTTVVRVLELYILSRRDVTICE